MTLPFDKEWTEAVYADGHRSLTTPQTPDEVLAGVCGGLLEEVLDGALSPELAKAKIGCAPKLLNELRTRGDPEARARLGIAD
jgi:hypothetical protein